jgi:hypothetical protein
MLTSYGYMYTGLVDDRSWASVKDKFNQEEYIVSLRLDGDQGSATIDDNKDGYFLGNKMIASMQGGFQVNLVGIGYWTKNEETARIKWYNSDTMQLMFTEARPTEECGFFLIRNK